MEVISLEIHPGREWREIEARGRKLGLDPAKSETEGSCVPAASTIHTNTGPRSSESENGETVGASPAGNQIARKSPIQFTPLNNFVSV